MGWKFNLCTLRDRRGDSRIARLALYGETCLHVPACVEDLPQGGMARKAAAVPAVLPMCRNGRPKILFRRRKPLPSVPGRRYRLRRRDVVPYEAAGCLGQNQTVFPRNKKGIKRIFNVPYAGEKVMLFPFPWLGFVGDDVHGVPFAWKISRREEWREKQPPFPQDGRFVNRPY